MSIFYNAGQVALAVASLTWVHSLPRGQAAARMVGRNYCYSSIMPSGSLSLILGSKFVTKGGTGIRKQYLNLNGKTIIGFVPLSGKFSDCVASGFSDVTSQVTCKVIF